MTLILIIVALKIIMGLVRFVIDNENKSFYLRRMVYKISPKLAIVLLLICGIFALFSGEVGFAVFMFIGVGVWMYIIKDFKRDKDNREDVQDRTSDNDQR